MNPATQGHAAAASCAEKAERVSGFDTEAAKSAVLECLTQWPGGRSGEDLTDHCKAKGIVPHNDKAFGAVFGSLSRAGQIVRAGYTLRRKGNGTSGATLWKLQPRKAVPSGS